MNFPPGTPLRDLFEKRLANREPPATFALTNSLAAALAPWLVVGLGIVAATWRERRRWIAWLICIVPIAVCLLLTRSRSGYAAVAVGVIWLAFRHWQRSRHNVAGTKVAGTLRVPSARSQRLLKHTAAGSAGRTAHRPTLRVGARCLLLWPRPSSWDCLSPRR